MSKRRKAIVIILPILLLCAVCAAPWAYWAYQDSQEYQADVDRLYEIAGQLGYSERNYIRFYQEKSFGIDFSQDSITLVFYSTNSFEQFLYKVEQLGLIQNNYNYNRQSIAADFLEEVVNHDASEKLVSINNHYLSVDFDSAIRPPPIVTRWGLQDTGGRKTLVIIHYVQTPRDEDVWMVDSQPISGNIVVVELNRLTGVR